MAYFKVFSSITILHKYNKRYDRTIFYNKWKRPIKINNEKMKKLIKRSSDKTTVKELFNRNNLPYRVTKEESNIVYLLPNNYLNYMNKENNVYLVGLRGLKKDNLEVRIIEQLAYWFKSYEASESAKSKSLFYFMYNTTNEDDILKETEYGCFKKILLDELDENGNHVKVEYYKYFPK